MDSGRASITAKEKLEEAKFFIEKLRGLQLFPQDLETQHEVHYYLSAFLSASVSVIDYLLEDYNVKFSILIPLTKKLTPNTFKKESKRTSNDAALQFLQYWVEKKKALKNDPIGKLLVGKRHINIHRVQTKPDIAKIKAMDKICFLENAVVYQLKGGKSVETYRSPEQFSIESKTIETKFDWFFSEYPDEPMMTVCDKFLEMIESFVSAVEKKFL